MLGCGKRGLRMPTVFMKNGFRFFFYSADGNEPIHIHVEYGNGTAKFWLNPVKLAYNMRLKKKDLKRAGNLIQDHLELIVEEWDAHFGK